MIHVAMAPAFSVQKIHYYLHRKYESESYLDENMSIVEIPLLDTILPDDAVTKQLIKHGYYQNPQSI